MIAKKWRKLEKQLDDENQKDNDEENNEEENGENKEVLIVDVESNVNEDVKKEEEKEDENDNDNEKDVNKSINSSKSRLSKPQPILNVDAGSIKIVDYKVKNDNNEYTNKYPVRYYKYYTGNNSSSYTPNNHTFYSSSYNINNKNYNNNYNNNYNHINNLAKSNDYSYRIPSTTYSRNNPLLNRNETNYKNNLPYKLNNNTNYNTRYNLSNDNSSPYSNNNILRNKNNNNGLTYSYSFILQQKPNKLRSLSSSTGNLNRNKYSYVSKSYTPYRLSNEAQKDLNPRSERVTYVLNNYRYDSDPNTFNKNYSYRDYSSTIPLSLNYNYLYN